MIPNGYSHSRRISAACIKRRTNMKKRNILCVLLIAACLLAYRGYRMLDRISADTTPPQISIPEESVMLSVHDPETLLLQGVTAADNADGDVTDSLVIEKTWMADADGLVNVRYAAFDQAGNVAKADRQVQYTDYQSPRFVLEQPLVYRQNYEYDVLAAIRAEDMLEGDISHRIRATSLADQSMLAPGIHDVEFRVSNSLGETVQLILPVEVRATDSYQAELFLTDYLIYLEAGDRFNAQDYLDRYVWNGTTTSLEDGLPWNYALETIGEVDTQVPGVYSVTYQVAYTSDYSRQAFTGCSKLIVVVEG